MAQKLPKLSNKVRGKDYIETKNWSAKELELALDTAADLKKLYRKGKPHRYLPDKTVFLFFFDKSTRTRNSFEAGATQRGGDLTGAPRPIPQGYGHHPLRLRPRNRDPSRSDAGGRERLHAGGGGARPRAGAQHAVRHRSEEHTSVV